MFDLVSFIPRAIMQGIPLLFGMVSGVYSTICIATPLWVDWKNKKKAPKKA